jgi:hypothetical protein
VKLKLTNCARPDLRVGLFFCGKVLGATIIGARAGIATGAAIVLADSHCYLRATSRRTSLSLHVKKIPGPFKIIVVYNAPAWSEPAQADTIDASVNVGAPKYLRFGQNEPEIVE